MFEGKDEAKIWRKSFANYEGGGEGAHQFLMIGGFILSTCSNNMKSLNTSKRKLLSEVCNLRDQLGIVVFMLGVNAVFSVVQELLQCVVGLGLYLEFVLLPNLNSHQSYVDIQWIVKLQN